MQTFEAWLVSNHPEILEEGVKDWAGKMALGGALTAGALGLLGKSATMPTTSTSSGSTSTDEMQVNFGGLRQVSVTLRTAGDKGVGRVTFLGVHSFGSSKDDEISMKKAHGYAERAIFKVAGLSSGYIKGFKFTKMQHQGDWIIADFEWRSLE